MGRIIASYLTQAVYIKSQKHKSQTPSSSSYASNPPDIPDSVIYFITNSVPSSLEPSLDGGEGSISRVIIYDYIRVFAFIVFRLSPVLFTGFFVVGSLILFVGADGILHSRTAPGALPCTYMYTLTKPNLHAHFRCPSINMYLLCSLN